MSADQHNRKPSASAPDPQAPQPNSSKVRSTRYDWAHDIAPAEAPDQSKPDKMTARQSLMRRLLDRLLDFFRRGRNPFDRDDDPDPMAA